MFVFNSDVSFDYLDATSRRKILAHEGGLMMVEVTFDKGGRGNVHTHPHEQITYVHKGVFEFSIADETKIVQEGDSLYFPPNVPHGCEALEEGMLIDVFTPQRQDFLKK